MHEIINFLWGRFSKKSEKGNQGEVSAEVLAGIITRATAREVKMEETSMLAIKIRRARQEAGISLNELSTKTGIDTETLLDMEFGAFPLHEMVRIIQEYKDAIRLHDSAINATLFK